MCSADVLVRKTGKRKRGDHLLSPNLDSRLGAARGREAQDRRVSMKVSEVSTKVSGRVSRFKSGEFGLSRT